MFQYLFTYSEPIPFLRITFIIFAPPQGIYNDNNLPIWEFLVVVDMETVRAEEGGRGRTKMNLSARIPPLGNRRTRIFPDSHILFTFSSFLGNRL